MEGYGVIVGPSRILVFRNGLFIGDDPAKSIMYAVRSFAVGPEIECVIRERDCGRACRRTSEAYAILANPRIGFNLRRFSDSTVDRRSGHTTTSTGELTGISWAATLTS